MTARATLLALLGACSAPNAATPAASTSPPMPPPTAARPGASAMPQHLHELIALLSRDVTLADLTAALGPIAQDPGAPQPEIGRAHV